MAYSYSIPLLKITRSRWVWRAIFNMSMHYLKIEVTKYICPLLRLFKIAGQIQRSRDLITEYK